MGRVNYGKLMTEAVEKKLGPGVGVEEAIEYLLDTGTLDRAKCKIALVYDEYSRMTGEGMKGVDALKILSEKYNVSTSRIEKYIYYYTEVRL